jgi:hypothetical protein
MKAGVFASVAAFVAGVAVVVLASGPLAAQAGKSADAKGGTWRTAWGDPDLQGKWQFAETATPMERPKQYADRAMLTDQEAAARAEAFSKRQRQADDPDSDVAFPEQQANAPAHEKGIRGVEYNRFWVDAGERKVKLWKRTSLVVDPPDGRIPPFTPEAIKRIEEREAARANRGEAEGWEDRNINERCLQTAFMRTGGGEREIIQTPGYVAIIVGLLNTNEPIIVPMDGRPKPSDSVRRWNGFSRGRWDGSTLVVETTHINGQQDGGPVMASRTPYQRFLGAGDTVKITERFTRVDADTIEHSYTIEDPKTYVRPYTVLRPMTKADSTLLMPENACHEGNYGIVGQLSGGRADEEYSLRAAKGEAELRKPLLQEMKRRTEEWVRANQKR